MHKPYQAVIFDMDGLTVDTENIYYNVMCDFKSKCATIPCHAEEADRLTKHLLPIHSAALRSE